MMGQIRGINILFLFAEQNKVEEMKLITRKKQESGELTMHCSVCDHLFQRKYHCRIHLHSVHLDLYEQVKKSADEEEIRSKSRKRKGKQNECGHESGSESSESEAEWMDQDGATKSQSIVQKGRSTRVRKPTANAAQAATGAQDVDDDKLKKEVKLVLKRLTQEEIEYHTTKIMYLYR